MPLVALSLPPRQTDVRAAVVTVSVAAASFGLLFLSPGPRVAFVVTGCLVVFIAWVALVARSRMVVLDTERKKVIVRWRNALFARREAELPLGRFAYVVSYYQPGKMPRNCVTLVEGSLDRALQIAAFPAEYQGHGFGSAIDLVEVEAAKQLRASLSRRLGIPDGGYKGVHFPLLRSSEETI
jgi:membrane protein YdbS with pleckstrin-like domain